MSDVKNYKEDIKNQIWDKKEEGEVKQLSNDQIVLSVDSAAPNATKLVKDNDIQSFEDFKILYKGVIDMKCMQDYNSCDDKSLWEDTAKEIYLKSKYYVPMEDDMKPTKIEESLEALIEDGDSDCSNKEVVEDNKVETECVDTTENTLEESYGNLGEYKVFTKSQYLKLADKYGEKLNNYEVKMQNNKFWMRTVDYNTLIEEEPVTENKQENEKEVTNMNAIEFVQLCDNLKKLGLWDGQDDTFKEAVAKYYDICETDRQLKTESSEKHTYDISYHIAEYDKVIRNEADTYCIKVENRTAQTETKWMLVDKAYIEAMKEIENNYDASKESATETVEEAKLQEDQYETSRRRGVPCTKRIAEQEVYDNQEWYQNHIKDYIDITDFVNKNITEIASEYNLQEAKAEEACKEIYKLAITLDSKE